MFRLFSCVCAGALFVAVAPAADDEAIELKNYLPKVGDRTRVTDEERTTTRSIFTVGEKREDKVERHTKLVVYVSEVLAVKKGEKKGTKIKRVYEKAEDVKDTATKLPLHGKTVVIEKKGDKYTFAYDDGKAVDGEAREQLDKEFNKKDEATLDDLIPKRPLKPGETWKMDTDKLIKAFAKEDAFAVDKKGASGSGKLAEVYTFGGNKYGVFDLRIEFPLSEISGENKIPLKAGSKMTMHIVGDGNVDGAEPDGAMTMQLSLRIFFEAPNGAEGCIKADSVATRAVEKLPARPRD
jgi:hypothetical protein